MVQRTIVDGISGETRNSKRRFHRFHDTIGVVTNRCGILQFDCVAPLVLKGSDRSDLGGVLTRRSLVR